ncbi:hypothetical protein AAFC00_002051 [Neodothiora populina]|uniref:DUF2470 domain-containing protein n=1 Tax=Neodothiora populina TaxID=2781224 RepID=A0ABR3PG76_9PEZI
MSGQAAKDAAAKERIITHMNNDHHDSVVRYLECYHRMPGYKAYTGKISDISLTELTFTCANETFKTPFEPPLTSYREARERVVQMDKDCLVALNRSNITVKKYIPPHGRYAILFAIVTITFAAFSMRSNFSPDGYVATYIHAGFARFCWAVQPLVMYGMLVIHSSEAYHMATGRLRKHSVNMRSKIWWQWLYSTFIEGVGSFDRFDKMIKRECEAQEKQKH